MLGNAIRLWRFNTFSAEDRNFFAVWAAKELGHARPRRTFATSWSATARVLAAQGRRPISAL